MMASVLLRQQQKPYDKYIHPHSWLSMQLKMDIIESEIYFNSGMSYLNAWASISSHENSDLKTAVSNLPEIYYNIRKVMPFMCGNKTYNESKEEERKHMAENYHRMMDYYAKWENKLKRKTGG